MTDKQFSMIGATLDIMHEDVEERFAGDCGLLSISGRYNGEEIEYEFNASGNVDAVAESLAAAMEANPALVLLIQRAVELGDADKILSNYTTFLLDNIDKFEDDDDDTDY